MIIGSTMYTYGLTNIITVAVGMQRDKTAFQEKMDDINSYMAFRGVPASLQANIRTYLAERSSKGRSWDEKERDLLTDLSPQLQAKVAIVINQAVLKRTRFLWHTTPEFVTRIILSMSHQHFPPEEYVAVEEDPADKLFILTMGSVDLLKWGRFRVQTLTSKSQDAFFGELALLGETNCVVKHPALMRVLAVTIATDSQIGLECRSRPQTPLDRASAWCPHEQRRIATSGCLRSRHCMTRSCISQGCASGSCQHWTRPSEPGGATSLGSACGGCSGSQLLRRSLLCAAASGVAPWTTRF